MSSSHDVPVPVSNSLPVFRFETLAVHVVVDSEGNPWFVAKDVSDVLGYSRTNKMTARLDDDEKKNMALLNGANYANHTLISESGLYSAILGSELPSARRFQDWVCEEVLPTIRKTGSYSLYTPKTPQTYSEALRAAADEAERRYLAEEKTRLETLEQLVVSEENRLLAEAKTVEAEAKVIEMTPKAEYHD